MRHLWLGITLLAAATPAMAQDSKHESIDITTVTCRAVMAGDDRGRELAMAYMHGYLNGKAGGTVVETDHHAAVTDKVRDYCLDNPTAKFMSTFETLSKK